VKNSFFLKGRKKDFGKVMGVFLRIIGPLAEAIQGPSVYFDVIFFTVSLYDEVAIISDIVIIFH
jgi:hypothetical protein